MADFSSFESIWRQHWKSPSFQKSWASMLSQLDNRFNGQAAQLNQLKATVGTAPNRSEAAPSATGILGTGIISDTTPIAVPNTIGAAPGQLVLYRGTTFALATNNTAGMAANFAVGRVDGMNAYLYQSWHSGLLRVLDGRGTNADGYLYLYQNGSCTDLESDIQDADGDFQNGSLFLQQVGYSQLLSGLVPEGFVRCSLYLSGLHY